MSPSEVGYRALHVIVVRDGRLIEIQLRTLVEHEWAVAVERTGRRLGFLLKEGSGPVELKEYFRVASQGMYLDSLGQAPSQEFSDEFRRARLLAAQYLQPARS